MTLTPLYIYCSDLTVPCWLRLSFREQCVWEETSGWLLPSTCWVPAPTHSHPWDAHTLMGYNTKGRGGKVMTGLKLGVREPWNHNPSCFLISTTPKAFLSSSHFLVILKCYTAFFTLLSKIKRYLSGSFAFNSLSGGNVALLRVAKIFRGLVLTYAWFGWWLTDAVRRYIFLRGLLSQPLS